MADTPPASWIETAVDVLKYALAPFGSMAGWYGLKWAWTEWTARGDINRKAKREEASERDKVLSNLTTQQATWVDRLERNLETKTQECERIRIAHEETRTNLLKELDALRRASKANEREIEIERDQVWQLALDQEEEAHRIHHAFVRTISERNALLIQFQRQLQGTLSPEAAAEITRMSHEAEPPRVSDLRGQLRTVQQRVKDKAE